MLHGLKECLLQIDAVHHGLKTDGTAENFFCPVYEFSGRNPPCLLKTSYFCLLEKLCAIVKRLRKRYG